MSSKSTLGFFLEVSNPNLGTEFLVFHLKIQKNVWKIYSFFKGPQKRDLITISSAQCEPPFLKPDSFEATTLLN